MTQERRPVSIHLATEADIPAIQSQCFELMKHVKKWSKTLKPDWVHSESGLAYFQECITDPQATLLKATVNEEIAGFAAGFYKVDSKPYREERRFADLDFFYVDDRFRRQGVGNALVKTFSEWCKTNQVGVIRVETTYNNQVAQNFYSRFDFKPYELVMEKKLT